MPLWFHKQCMHFCKSCLYTSDLIEKLHTNFKVMNISFRLTLTHILPGDDLKVVGIRLAFESTDSHINRCNVSAVKVCPEVNLQNGDFNNSVRTYGAQVNATCNSGYSFSGGNSTMTVTCTQDKIWSDQLFCSREYILISQQKSLTCRYYLFGKILQPFLYLSSILLLHTLCYT